MTTAWRYQVIEVPMQLFTDGLTKRAQAELDKAGAQGWELVSTVQSSTTDSLRLFLKKPS